MYPVQDVIIAVFRSFPTLVGGEEAVGSLGLRGKYRRSWLLVPFSPLWVSVVRYQGYTGNLILKLGFDLFFHLTLQMSGKT